MPQYRFDTCSAYEGLTPDVNIRRVTFEPPLDADQAESRTGYVSINSGFVETVETEAQDTWFDDMNGQIYTRIRTLVSTDATTTRLLTSIYRSIIDERNGEGGDLQVYSGLLNGNHNFTEEQAEHAATLLFIPGTHRMPGSGHFHPGQTHAEFRRAIRRLAACVRMLTSQNIPTANSDGNFGRNERISFIENGRLMSHENVGRATFGNLFALENSMLEILFDPNFAGQVEKTIGDDGEEIRIANLPRAVFNRVRLDTDHITVMSFSYIDTNALRDHFEERPDGNSTRLDFTFSQITTAVVQSSVFIETIASSTEEQLSPDTGNLSPQAGIFQDLRGVFALSNRTLDVRAGFTEERASNGVNLADFEDEISSMSVDVNEEIRKSLSRRAVVFSDLWVSRRRSDALDLSFVFNERLFLKQSTTFPKLYGNEKFSLLARGLGGGISNIRVYKQQINPNIAINDNSLSTTSRSSLMIGVDEEKKYISVGPRNEMLINEFTDQINYGASGRALAEGLIFLTCTDYENEGARNLIGKSYRYGVEIDYVDPTVDMVLRLTNGLLEAAQKIKDISEDLVQMPSEIARERRILHVRTTDRLEEVLDVWMPILEDLVDLNIVSGAKSFASYVMQMMGDSTQTVYERAENINRIVDLFEFYGSELEIELRKTIPGIEVYPGDDSPEAANYASSAGSGRGSTSRSINKIDYVFNQTVPADQGAGYDYIRYDALATRNPGLEIVTLSDFIARCDTETEKYFRDTTNIKGVERSKVKYLTPSAIINPLGMHLIQDSESIDDYKRYANFTAGLISYKSQKQNLVIPEMSNDEPQIEDAGVSTTNLLVGEMQNHGVVIDFGTDKNSSKDVLSSNAPFSNTVLGRTKNGEVESNQNDLKDREERLNSRRGEEEEMRRVANKPVSVTKALSNLLGPMSLFKNAEGRSDNKANSFTKVVIEEPRIEDLDTSEFPNQLKAMINIVLAKYNNEEDDYENYNYNFEELRPLVGPNNQQTGLSDPMRDYFRFAAYWLNFKQIARVQILDQFPSTQGGHKNVSSAQWKDITVEDINSLPVGSCFMCRVSSLVGGKNSLQKLVDKFGLNAPSGFDLPLYNQYFLLTRTNEEADVRVIEPEFQPPPQPAPEPEPEQQVPLQDLGIDPDLGRVILPGLGDELDLLSNTIIPKLDLPQINAPDINKLVSLPKIVSEIVTPIVPRPVAPNPSRVRGFENLVKVVNQVAKRPGGLSRRPVMGQNSGNMRREPRQQQTPRQQQAPRQQQVQQNVQFRQTRVRTNVPRAGMGNFGRGVARNVSRNVGRIGGGVGGGGGY